jgi:hypothetical protein
MKNPRRLFAIPACLAMAGTAALLHAQDLDVTDLDSPVAAPLAQEAAKPPGEQTLAAEEEPEPAEEVKPDKPKKETSGEDQKPKKDKKKGKDRDSGESSSKSGAKDAEPPKEKKAKKDDTNDGDWCTWLQDKPGELYRKKKNPYLQSFRIEGRFQYQAYHTSGTDVRGNAFNDSGSDVRRFRLGTTTRFLNYFDLDINANMVDDNRFRGGRLDWGYSDFDAASIGFNAGKAFGTGPLDTITFRYGRMKLPLSEEVHQSSRRIYTLERSSLADKVGGRESRPTGAMLGLGKDDWSVNLGIFSGEDDADFIGGWNDGEVFYGSVEWQATKEFRLLLDHAQNNQRGDDDMLGYAWATSLAGVYQKKDWGTLVNLIYGDNGGAGHGNANPLRQGDFYGVIVMPWYWVVEDKLQLVFRYQYAASDNAEGVRLNTRYARASHSPPDVDLDNGYGDEHHSFYLGLNYHLCGDNAKIMVGVDYEEMSARTAKFDAITYMIGFRTFF